MVTANDICLAVMTVQRSPEYIHATLASLFASDPLVHDLKGVHLLVGSADAQYLSGYRHHSRIHIHPMSQAEADQLSKWTLPRKVCFNYHRCLTLATAGAAGICICEDDVLFQDGFVGSMLSAINEMEQEHKILQYALRLFIPFEFGSEHPVPVGKYCSQYNPRTFYGNQCMYYPSRVSPEIAEVIHKHGIVRYRAPADLLVRAYVEETGALYGTSRSLVQHVGFSSTLASMFAHAPSFREGRSKGEVSTESENDATATFDLCEALAGTIKRLGLVAERQGLELIYCAESSILQCTLKGDPEPLRQQVCAQIEQVIQSSEQGNIVVRLHMELEEEGRVRLHFMVNNDMNSDVVDKDIPVLAKADETQLGRARGALGLEPMGARVSEELGGRSRPLHFSIGFSLAEDSGPMLASRSFAGLDGVQTMVVADKAAARQLLVQMLSRWGMVPTAVEDGRSALTAIREKKGAGNGFRLVLLDADLPKMSGFETAKQIRKDPNASHLEIVMLTRISGGEEVCCRKAGITDRVTKPVLEHELLEMVRGLVNPRGGNRMQQGYVNVQKETIWQRIVYRLRLNLNRLAGV